MTGMAILNHVPRNSFMSGSRASEVRRIDPKTGKVVEIVKVNFHSRYHHHRCMFDGRFAFY